MLVLSLCYLIYLLVQSCELGDIIIIFLVEKFSWRKLSSFLKSMTNGGELGIWIQLSD